MDTGIAAALWAVVALFVGLNVKCIVDSMMAIHRRRMERDEIQVERLKLLFGLERLRHPELSDADIQQLLGQKPEQE